jgi:hypothetical protein
MARNSLLISVACSRLSPSRILAADLGFIEARMAAAI